MNRRKNFLNKAAGITLLTLAISLILPVLAYATVGFSNVSYKDSTVTGTVYATSDEGLGVTSSVYVDIFDPAGNKITTTEATYQSVTGTTYHYTFSENVGVFSYVKLLETVTSSVYATAERTTTGSGGGGGGGCSGCGGGIGGGDTTPDAGDVLEIPSGQAVDADTLKAALEQHATVTLKTDGDTLILPASALLSARDGAMLIIVTKNGTYQLPVAVLDLQAIAASLDVDVADLQIKVVIEPVSEVIQANVKHAATSVGASLIAPALEFKLLAATSSGQEQEIASFGDTYVKRSVTLDQEVDFNHASVVMYHPTSGTLTFVPAVFEITEEGQTIVTFMRTGNSVYAVVQADKSFADIPSQHWGKKDIELLASKLIVAGETPTEFRPEQHITRAEFAGLVVRSLGLIDTQSADPAEFSDVAANAWYAKEVALAADAGIVYGYGDGTFRPNNLITREELAAMVVRALKYSGTDTGITASEQQAVYQPYRDVGEISAWANASLAVAIRDHIVYGESATRLAPQQNATRAEATAMLKRYLVRTGFINT